MVLGVAIVVGAGVAAAAVVGKRMKDQHDQKQMHSNLQEITEHQRTQSHMHIPAGGYGDPVPPSHIPPDLPKTGHPDHVPTADEIFSQESVHTIPRA